MTSLFPDTTPEAEAYLIRGLREMPAWRKLEMVAQINETVKILTISGLRSRFPNDPPKKINRRLADLLLGEDLALKVYGPLMESYPGE